MDGLVCIASSALALMILLVALAFIGYTVYVAHVHAKYSHIPGPPISSFYFGNLADLRKLEKHGGVSHMKFVKWAETYGPVFRIFVLHQCMLVVSGRDQVREILTKSIYPKASLIYDSLQTVCGKRYLGQGLVTQVVHRRWAEHKAIINPAFHKRSLQALMEQFNETADAWVESLRPLADGKTYIDVADLVGRATLDVIGKVGFHMETNAISNAGGQFPIAILKILEGMSAQRHDPLLKLRFGQKNFVRDVKSAASFIRSHGQKIVEERIAKMAHGERYPDDMLTYIIRSAGDGDHVDMEQLLDEFCTLLLAGQETTANVMGFLFKELGRRVDCQQSLTDEIDSVIGDHQDITLKEIEQLEYVSQVVKETLRMYPPAPGTARETPDDTVLGGHHIPRGSLLVVSFVVMHHLAEFHADPFEFRPERFAPDQPRPKFTYMPFSMGQRSCAGQHFAQIEVKVLISKFFQNFRYELQPGQSFGIQETATLRPQGGTWVRLTPR